MLKKLFFFMGGRGALVIGLLINWLLNQNRKVFWFKQRSSRASNQQLLEQSSLLNKK
ncbi:unnamed protein product [Linum tenue]|uniref:Uncharacterized protein n=1 Tax=Linum tenue TaxID=586396 RepID=A0AAV0KVC9_9ROSI|nr:unnamed protein product [Linum tenue]